MLAFSAEGNLLELNHVATISGSSSTNRQKFLFLVTSRVGLVRFDYGSVSLGRKCTKNKKRYRCYCFIRAVLDSLEF